MTGLAAYILSAILLFILVSSGSVFAAAFWDRRFEEVLPLTCTGIVLILYICGLGGYLPLGAAIVFSAGALAYAASAVHVWRAKALRAFLRRLAGFPLLVFTASFVVFSICNYEKLAWEWDEFSHWMDIVKVMATLDDFGTNPQANALFASYPPGMALFQYTPQKIYRCFAPGAMDEGLAYLAYQVFAVSFLIPFLKDARRDDLFTACVSAAVIFLCPLAFFSNFYVVTYVDPFLGILLGTGLAAVFLQKTWDTVSSLRVCAACFMLVLAKDAGLLLSLFPAVAYILSILFFDGPSEKAPSGRGRKCLGALMALCSVIVPRISWQIHLKLTNTAAAFSQPYDPGLLLRIAAGRDASYRADVWRNFWNAFVRRGLTLGSLELHAGCLTLYILAFALIGGLALSCKRKGLVSGKKALCVVALTALSSAVYTLGLCATYITRFDEYEAMILASYERYMSIQLLGCWVFLLLLAISVLPRLPRPHGAAALILAGVLLISPCGYTFRFLTRESILESREIRGEHAQMARQIEACTPGDAAVWLISQESSGMDLFMLHFEVRPRYITSTVPWSIGVPFYDGDIWTEPMSAEQWRTGLTESFDYVALYRLNGYFYENYASVFADPGEIGEGLIYRVNTETGLLEKCVPENGEAG